MKIDKMGPFWVADVAKLVSLRGPTRKLLRRIHNVLVAPTGAQLKVVFSFRKRFPNGPNKLF